ncbi:MAG: sigma-54-dependent transcriptional regulator [Spirochaetota bacterium]
MISTDVRILVVDDDRWIVEYLKAMIDSAGYLADTATEATTALTLLDRHHYTVVLSDVAMDGMDGLELLSIIRAMSDPPDVIMISGTSTIDTAVRAIKEGATDFLTKPLDNARVVQAIRLVAERHSLRHEVETLRAQMHDLHGDGQLIAVSEKMRGIVEMVEVLGRSEVPVLLEAESGTGKEVIARAIHRRSDRSSGPFVGINCGALPEALLESELFGYERGAFTGATKTKPGIFEATSGGTLLLDEIGEMPLHLQATLLRVLQERTIRRVGGTKDVPVDVRVLSATNRDLAAMVAAGLFREDLYYRLRVVPVRIPPLRERQDDVIPLAKHFLDMFARRHGKSFDGFDEQTLALLRAHSWPGNIRELENLIHGVVALYPGGQVTVERTRSLLSLQSPSSDSSPLPPGSPAQSASETLASSIQGVERKAIDDALARFGGNHSSAAEALGMSRTTLWRKLKRLETERR